MQSYIPIFVDHVAFRVPMLVLSIPKDLDELLENGCLASVTPLRKSCRVVIVTVYISLVLIVAILCTEHCWTDGARKVLNVILALEGCDVRTAKCTATGEAEEVQSSEVVGLAERILARWLIGYWKEFGCYDLAAVIASEALKMVRVTECTHKLSLQLQTTFSAHP